MLEEKKKALFFSCIILGFLDSCPEQLNLQITQKEIGLECRAHFFVPLFPLGSSFLGLKTKFNSEFFSFKLQGAAEGPGAEGPAAAALSPRAWSAALRQQSPGATMWQGAKYSECGPHLCLSPSCLATVLHVLTAPEANTLEIFFKIQIVDEYSTIVELYSELLSEGPLSPQTAPSQLENGFMLQIEYINIPSLAPLTLPG